MTVYVVMGSTGEYSDRNEWGVAVYSDENLAKEHVQRATKVANEIKVHNDRAREEWEKKCQELGPEGERFGWGELPPGLREVISEWDPHLAIYYTGTRYWYIPLPLLSKLWGSEE